MVDTIRSKRLARKYEKPKDGFFETTTYTREEFGFNNATSPKTVNECLNKYREMAADALFYHGKIDSDEDYQEIVSSSSGFKKIKKISDTDPIICKFSKEVILFTNILEQKIEPNSLDSTLINFARLMDFVYLFGIAEHEEYICKGYGSDSGTKKGNKIKSKVSSDAKAKAQALADKVWSEHPRLSKKAVARKIQPGLINEENGKSYSVAYIERHFIKKGKKS